MIGRDAGRTDLKRGVDESAYDLGVVHETLSHDLGSSEFTPPDENVDV